MPVCISRYACMHISQLYAFSYNSFEGPGRHFTLITDQKSMSFMFNAQHTGKSRIAKSSRRRLKLAYQFQHPVLWIGRKPIVFYDRPIACSAASRRPGYFGSSHTAGRSDHGTGRENRNTSFGPQRSVCSLTPSLSSYPRHCIRSLMCTSPNVAPYERLFAYSHRSARE